MPLIKFSGSFFFRHTWKITGNRTSPMNWIEILYNSPMAILITNGLIFPRLSFQRGTTQGSLSAFLKGFQTTSSHHKISLYSENNITRNYEKHLFSNKYLSIWSTGKNPVSPLCKGSCHPGTNSTPIPMSTVNIRYLGINISTNLCKLVA